jgi:hypothetical protein
MPSNAYSARWHDTFHRSYHADVTAAEVAFLPGGCRREGSSTSAAGFGRHLRGLRERGYEVVGVERDPAVAAEQRAPR